MALSRGEINPLGVLKMRKLNFVPEHFSKISFDRFVNIKDLEHWITFNLNSRYSLKKKFDLDQNNKIVEVIEVGLEDPREITMLTLGCPHIHKTKELF